MDTLSLNSDSVRVGTPSTSIKEMHVLLDLAREIEDKCVELDIENTTLEAGIQNAGKLCAANIHTAETQRESIVENIKLAYKNANLEVPKEVGMMPPRAVPNYEQLGSKLDSLVREIRTHDQGLVQQRSTMQTLKTITLPVGVILTLLGCVNSTLGGIGFLVLVAFAMFAIASTSSSSKESKALRAEFASVAFNYDVGSLDALNAARIVAEHQKGEAIKSLRLTYSARTDVIKQKISHLEETLLNGIEKLDQGLTCGSWEDESWREWMPVRESSKILRLGWLIPTMPRHEHHYSRPNKFQIPALINFESGKGVIIKASQGLEEARTLAQSVVTRLLATVPPAGVRFTFIDPVSLGRNVAGFMSLEKFEPTLIGGKAWSDSNHIDKALSGLTEHMETVIQKYLREDYSSIEAYNEKARVKESYRIVMVFDFPVNFTESSAKKLASIFRNGPRCGVFPLVIVDTTKPLPYGFSIGDLEQFAIVFNAADQGNSSQI